MMVVVAIGGSMGTLLRYQILLNWPVTLGEEFPLPVVITNLIASLFLGIFLAHSIIAEAVGLLTATGAAPF